MEFRLLGRVEAMVEGLPVGLGPRRQRLVLAVLALEANRLVPVDRLVELSWPMTPPRTAVHAIRVSASQLRSVLARTGGAQYNVELVGNGAGYMLRTDAMRVDAHRFRSLIGRARGAHSAERKVALLRQALDLWRGPALTGIGTAEMRDGLACGLEEARLVALEERIEAELGLGRHRELLDELTELVAEHTLRERLTALLMLALYRSGQVGAALAAYQRTRGRLAEELGIEPGTDLRQLEVAMLRNDPALAAPSHRAAAGCLPGPMPAPSYACSTSPPAAAPVRPDTALLTGPDATALLAGSDLIAHQAEPDTATFPAEPTAAAFLAGSDAIALLAGADAALQAWPAAAALPAGPGTVTFHVGPDPAAFPAGPDTAAFFPGAGAIPLPAGLDAALLQAGPDSTTLDAEPGPLQAGPDATALQAGPGIAMLPAGPDAAALRAWAELAALQAGPNVTALQATLAAPPPGWAQRRMTPRPAQLPPAVPGFTGRTAALRELTELTGQRDDSCGPASIVTITGPAGAGKTALAVHWARHARDRFADGQLFADLRGYAREPALGANVVLGGFLRALGVPRKETPGDPAEAAALFRTLLDGKRMLILLDNASSAQQVRPLLPATPGCLVLVTSRDRLGGLIASDGARSLGLDVLAPAEARMLLMKIAGEHAITVEPGEADRLARVCGCLPLALRAVAADLAGHPHRNIGEHAAALKAGRGLAAFAVDGDEQTAVRAAFDLSYDRLGPDARLLFRLLGLAGDLDITTGVAAALTGFTPRRAGQLLDQLACANLIQERAAGLFVLHNLFRRYADDLSQAGDIEPDSAEDQELAMLSGMPEALSA